mmetsp:Transcript_17877/g.37967  ORF Transcript_17877/g.37967 Transcript_17877/m.37967 type:complete len:90 (+) Transcript_17877:316-585(+)
MSRYTCFRAVVTVINIFCPLAKLDGHALQELANRCSLQFSLRGPLRSCNHGLKQGIITLRLNTCASILKNLRYSLASRFYVSKAGRLKM